MRKMNKGLIGIIAAASLTACTMNQRTDYTHGMYQEENTLTSNQYFTEVVNRETKLDAAEANREARCLEDLSKVELPENKALEELSSCVGDKRKMDMAQYLVLAGIIDGVKVFTFAYGLSGGSEGGLLSGGSNSSQAINNGNGNAQRTIYNGLN